jgi:small subunit ribosomal protein S27e
MPEKDLIPQPRSSFIRVKCNNCSNEQIVFDRATIVVKCNVCDEALTEPTGGKAKIKGDFLQGLR